MNQEGNVDQEVDLNYLAKTTNAFLKRCGIALYFFILFLKKNIYLLLIGLIVSGGLGYLLDLKLPKQLENVIVVAPNFGSTDFLYKSLPSYSYVLDDATNEEKSLVWEIEKLKVSPVQDFYELMHNNQSFFETFTVVSERTGDIKEVIEGDILSRNYRYHQITFTSKSTQDANVLADFILKQINNQPYYLKRKELELSNLRLRKEESEASLKQLNHILDQAGTATSLDKTTLNVNDFSALSTLVGTKESVLIELKRLDVLLQEGDAVVFEVDRMVNLWNKTLWNQYKYLLPIAFIGLFFVVSLFLAFMRKFKTLTTQQ